MLIGCAGRSRNGKTTVADVIEDEARRLGLTVAVYDIGKMVLEYCIGHQLLPSKSRPDLTSDELDVLVRIGQEQRNFDPDFWIRQVEASFHKDNPDVAIVPNLRSNNEVELIKKNKGATILVTCLNPNGSHYISRDRDPNHPLESDLLNINADYHLTVKRGQSALLVEQALTLFHYLRALEEQAMPEWEEEQMSFGNWT